MNAQQIRRQGFDKSSKDGDTIHVQCSQCEALVINGVPAHEHGCPNARRGARSFGDGLGPRQEEEEE